MKQKQVDPAKNDKEKAEKKSTFESDAEEHVTNMDVYKKGQLDAVKKNDPDGEEVKRRIIGEEGEKFQRDRKFQEFNDNKFNDVEENKKGEGESGEETPKANNGESDGGEGEAEKIPEEKSPEEAAEGELADQKENELLNAALGELANEEETPGQEPEEEPPGEDELGEASSPPNEEEGEAAAESLKKYYG